ncbi:extracellular solute-binding protein [Paenibacillus oceani]|uniref:Extracellular solute-binding protein n=1 Tax=Paenibacillus oceani TaxID=2772510 RepID=A0A927CBQ5_9BACL|nr:extracellular solute-binding protein [Paenibacillus oceani]MBD2863331.1 extracellular solute-binding protein [Paenibacillus oceani]
MKRRWCLAALSVMMLGAAACGAQTGTGAEPGDSQSKGDGGPESKPKQPIELYIQNIYSGSPTAEEFTDMYGRLIQQKFPHIESIHYYSNATRPLDQVLVNKDRMDIVITSQATFQSAFVANSLHTDISGYIAQTKYDVNRLDASSLNLVKQLGGGKLYGLPVDAGGTWLIYNKDLFDKFGVSYPSDSMTWEQFEDLAKKLSRTDGGVKYHGAALPPVNYLIRNPYGLNHIDAATGKASFQDPGWSRFLNRIADLYRIPGNEKDAQQLGTSGALNLFRKDKTAAMYSPIVSNDITLAFGLEDVNFDFTRFPSMSDAPGGVQTYPNIYALSATSPHKEDAFDVIAYMTSEEVQLAKSRRGGFASLNNDSIRAAFGQEAPAFIRAKNLKVFAEPNRYVTPTFFSEYVSIANTELNAALTSVVTGGTDMNTALRQAAESADRKIEQAKQAKK